MIFRDREDAGRQLAAKLERYRGEHPIVMALPRGGVPVGFEVARSLEAPLDVLVVRKFGAPDCPEFAIGAVAEGGAIFVSREALDEVGLTDEDAAAIAEQEAVEIARRIRAYRGDRPLTEIAGRTIIVVDDGVATGVSARASCRAIWERGAARVILATPVIALRAAAALRPELDDVVAVEVPTDFYAVGYWYERFPELTDEAVTALLRRARRTRPAVAQGELLWDDDWIGPVPSETRPGTDEQVLSIPIGPLSLEQHALEGVLTVPEGAQGLVLFVHGGGSTRNSPRNRYVAHALNRAGFATLLFDLLTSQDRAEDQITQRLRFDIELSAARVGAVTRWLGENPRTRCLRLGYFGSSTGAAVALVAAAHESERVGALVARGGRLDLVPAAVLDKVRAPTLLVVGGRDEHVLRSNQAALGHLRGSGLAVVPGAGHIFEDPGALAAVARLATRWFGSQLANAQEIAIGPNEGEGATVSTAIGRGGMQRNV